MRAGFRAPGFGELVGHSAVGAGLGIFLSLTLLIGDVGHMFEMIENSASPRITTLILMGIPTAILAVASTLTGLIFSAIEER